MRINYLLGDMVTGIRNGYKARLMSVKVKDSKLNVEVINILFRYGLIAGFSMNVGKSKVKLFLKYNKGMPIWYNIQLISTPGKRVYSSKKKIFRELRSSQNSGFYIVSTKFGIVTSDDLLCMESVGGEVLVKIEL